MTIKNLNFDSSADFIYEAGILAKTPRSGFWYLGTGKQNVAEHSFRTAIIAYMLAQMDESVDSNKVLVMALFHDFAEARTADANYVHQKYTKVDEKAAIKDAFSQVSFGDDVEQTLLELKKRETIEAQIVKEADNLELLAMLRDEQEKGNERASHWIKLTAKRLKTQNGKKLAKQLIERHPDDWWFDRDGQWWVDRTKDKKD
ncbi:MAG: HD domain-containing protein [Candidatus Moraniibacteriota bacterium]|jgi:5'-deoxynucleotidase YfbR-like HD superfamily hydrolase